MIEPNMKTTIENDSKKEASATSDSLTGESTLDKHAPQKPSMIEKLCIFIEKKWKIGLIATALLLTIVPLFVGWFAPHCKSEITADGILEYIVGALSFASTLALSALALWQTQKIQTESDKAQEEMKELSNRANELNLITKVVDFETARMQMIEEKCNAYINTCSESSIKAVVFLPSPTNVSELRKLQTESKTLSMSLFRLLESVPYSRDNVLEVKEKLELVDKYMYMLSENDLSIEKLAAILNNASSRTQDFNIAVINLIKDITERIQRCLYENRTLEEVQNQFKKEQ